MVERRIIEGAIVKKATRSGNGGHVIVPESWIGEMIRCVCVTNEEGDLAPAIYNEKELKRVSKDLHTQLEKGKRGSKK
jgi:putative transposon-encoded protein